MPGTTQSSGSSSNIPLSPSPPPQSTSTSSPHLNPTAPPFSPSLQQQQQSSHQQILGDQNSNRHFYLNQDLARSNSRSAPSIFRSTLLGCDIDLAHLSHLNICDWLWKLDAVDGLSVADLDYIIDNNLNFNDYDIIINKQRKADSSSTLSAESSGDVKPFEPLFYQVNTKKLEQSTKFQLFTLLINSYNPLVNQREQIDMQKLQLISIFLDSVMDTEMMKLAFIYVKHKLGYTYFNYNRFKGTLFHIFFALHTLVVVDPTVKKPDNGKKDEDNSNSTNTPTPEKHIQKVMFSSAFEHIFIGEIQFTTPLPSPPSQSQQPSPNPQAKQPAIKHNNNNSPNIHNLTLSTNASTRVPQALLDLGSPTFNIYSHHIEDEILSPTELVPPLFSELSDVWKDQNTHIQALLTDLSYTFLDTDSSDEECSTDCDDCDPCSDEKCQNTPSHSPEHGDASDSVDEYSEYEDSSPSTRISVHTSPSTTPPIPHNHHKKRRVHKPILPGISLIDEMKEDLAKLEQEHEALQKKSKYGSPNQTKPIITTTTSSIEELSIVGGTTTDEIIATLPQNNTEDNKNTPPQEDPSPNTLVPASPDFSQILAFQQFPADADVSANPGPKFTQGKRRKGPKEEKQITLSPSDRQVKRLQKIQQKYTDYIFNRLNQCSGQVLGLHFWYTYYLLERSGHIHYLGHKLNKNSLMKLNSPCLSFRFLWEMGSDKKYKDPQKPKKANNFFLKDRGSMVIGASPDWLLAFSAVCFFEVQSVFDHRYDLIEQYDFHPNTPSNRTVYFNAAGLGSPDPASSPLSMEKMTPFTKSYTMSSSILNTGNKTTNANLYKNNPLYIAQQRRDESRERQRVENLANTNTPQNKSIYCEEHRKSGSRNTSPTPFRGDRMYHNSTDDNDMPDNPKNNNNNKNNNTKSNHNISSRNNSYQSHPRSPSPALQKLNKVDEYGNGKHPSQVSPRQLLYGNKNKNPHNETSVNTHHVPVDPNAPAPITNAAVSRACATVIENAISGRNVELGYGWTAMPNVTSNFLTHRVIDGYTYQIIMCKERDFVVSVYQNLIEKCEIEDPTDEKK